MGKKIILLSAIQVFPPESGGQLRSANLAISLQKLGHDVRIISLTGRKEDYLRRVASGEIASEGIREWVNRSWTFGLLQWVSYKLSLPPLWVTYLAKYFLAREVNQVIESADLLFLDFPFLYPLAKSRPFLLNTHNAEFDLYKENRFLSRWVFKIEEKAFLKADKVFFCSEEDRERFSALGVCPPSLIVPNGVNLEDYRSDPQVRQQMRTKLNLNEGDIVFLFTGSQYQPNKEALTFLFNFIAKYQAYLLEKKIKFLVVGTVCNEKRREAVLIVEGRVPNITPYFAASDFGLNLVVTGSGTNVKMMEYLAAKLPILCTSFGMRGLQLENSALICEREDFLKELEYAIGLSISQRKQIAERAYEQNLVLLSMTDSLKSLKFEE